MLIKGEAGLAELSSSGKLPSNNTNASKNPTGINNKNNDSGNSYINRQQSENLQAKAVSKFSNTDVFKSTNPGRTTGNTSQNPFLRNLNEITPNNRTNPFSFIINTSAEALQRAVNPMKTIQADMQKFINNFISRFVNIMDKISAVFGEKEKDLRDNISNTGKWLKKLIYDFLGPIDASLEQKDHNKERKIKELREKLEEEDSFISTHRID